MSDLETLRLVYADLINERDRLRDARRSITAQLGPLPASAGLIIGLFAAFGDIESGRMTLLYGLALLPFLLVMLVSTLALRRNPYRKLTKREPQTAEGDDLLPEEEWLTQRIALERRSYVDLEHDFEEERTSLLRVQVLLGAEVVYLVLITALRPHIT